MPTRVLSFHYTLTDASGKVLDSSIGGEVFSFMEGAQQIIPGLERQLAGLPKGTRKKIHVQAEEAYGTRDEEKMIKVQRSQLPVKEVKIGDRFNGGGADGPVFVVTALTDSEATLDGNHALAGVDLTFDVELTDIREATAEEISHGHAHGAHGHSH